MKAKTLVVRESTLTKNGNNVKLIYNTQVIEAAELRPGDKMKHIVVGVGKRKFILSERVAASGQEHEELLDLLKG